MAHRAWRSGSTADRRRGNSGQERGGQGVEKVRGGKAVAMPAKTRQRRADHTSRKLAGVRACSSERLRSIRRLPRRLSVRSGCRRQRGNERCPWLRAWVDGLAGFELPWLGGDVGRQRGLLLLAGERERERELSGANERGGRGRGLLVVDQGASKASHGRHVEAATCRLATAARRDHRARARARGGRRGERVGWADFGHWARSEAAAHWLPVPFLFFFLKFFSKLFSKHFLTYLKDFSDFAPKTKVVQNNFLYNFAFISSG